MEVTRGVGRCFFGDELLQLRAATVLHEPLDRRIDKLRTVHFAGQSIEQTSRIGAEAEVAPLMAARRPARRSCCFHDFILHTKRV